MKRHKKNKNGKCTNGTNRRSWVGLSTVSWKSGIEDRGSRIEDRGKKKLPVNHEGPSVQDIEEGWKSRIEDRVEKKTNHEVPSARDVEEGWIKIKFLNEPKQT